MKIRISPGSKAIEKECIDLFGMNKIKSESFFRAPIFVENITPEEADFAVEMFTGCKVQIEE